MCSTPTSTGPRDNQCMPPPFLRQGLLGDLQRLSVARHQGQESEDSLHGALNLMQAAPVESLQALHKTLVA